MPLPTLYSAFRAWSQGIGQGPNTPALDVGNQYTFVDEEVWQEPLMQPLIGWLSFTAQTDAQCGWAMGTLEDHAFVAYLRGHRRETYYAHARLWRQSEWLDPESDPGAWMGNEAAFDERWSRPEEWVRRPLVAANASAAQWKASINAEPETATNLLAWLYWAVESDRLVLWQVPGEDFNHGGLPAWLTSFARAALPFSIRRRALLRVNAKDLREDLKQHPHLVVLRSDMAPIPADAVVLNRHGRAHGGATPGLRFRAYAQAVVERASKHPECLLKFSGWIEQRMPRMEGTGSEQVLRDSLRVVYNLALAATVAGAHDNLFAKAIWPETLQRSGVVLDWKRLVQPADLNQLSEGVLKQIALSPAITEDSIAFRSEIRGNLAARQLTLDGEIVDTWKPDMAHVKLVLGLTGPGGLVQADTLADCLLSLPAAVVAEVLRDESMVAAFLAMLPQGTPPANWRQPELLKPNDPAKLFLNVSAQSWAVKAWRLFLDAWAVEMASQSSLPAGVGPALKQIGLPEQGTAVTVLIAYGELYTRFPEMNLDARSLARSVQEHAEQRGQAGQVLGWCFGGQSRFLSEHLETQWVFNQVENPDTPDWYRWLDERMSTGGQLTKTTGMLVVRGCWLEWRRRSRLEPGELAKSAHAWIQSRPDHPRLEEWKQVIADLRGYSNGQVLEQIAETFPEIPGFREEQLADIGWIMTDLDALARLAVRPGGPGPAAFQDHRLLDGLPTDVLRMLTSRTVTRGLNLRQADLLMRRLETPSHVVYQLYVDAWARQLPENAGHPQAFWANEMFRTALVGWISVQEKPDQLRALDRVVQANEKTPTSNIDLVKLASRMNQLGCYRVASFLQPRDTTALYYRLVSLLLAGESKAPEWSRLWEAVRSASVVSMHPLCELAQSCEKLTPQQRTELGRHGWKTLLSAAETYPGWLDISHNYQRELPGFVLLAAICPSASLSRVVAEVLKVRCGIYPPTEAWLSALIKAIRLTAGATGRDADQAVSNLARMLILLGGKDNWPERATATAPSRQGEDFV
ncbi:MAG: hypothetical protein JNK87_24170 [Bryobacterales bacterium]|nr:hypothetical protein [Bryobacterales bacterium]